MEERCEPVRDTHHRVSAARSSRMKWVVYLTTYITCTITIGVFFSINKLFVDIRETFGTTRAQTATIHSTALGVGLCSGVLHGMICVRLGPRRTALLASCLATLGMAASFFATSITFLVVSIGIVSATGLVCEFIAGASIVGQYFRGTSAAMALSLLTTGPSVGGMLYPYVFGYLLEKYGLRGTLLLLAGIIMQTIPAVALWVPPRDTDHGSVTVDAFKGIDNLSIFTVEPSSDQTQHRVVGETTLQIQYTDNNARENVSINSDIINEVNANPDRRYSAVIIRPHIPKAKSGRLPLLKLLKNKEYGVYTLCLTLTNISMTVFLVFIVDFIIDLGYTQDNASLALLLLNIFNTLGRLMPGFFMHRSAALTFFPALLSAILGIVTMVCITFFNSLTVVFVLCCAMGTAIGTVSALVVTVHFTIGVADHEHVIGIIISVFGVTNLAAGPLSGLIRDQSGSYRAPFLGCLGPLLLSLLLILPLQRWYRARQRTRNISASLSYISKL